ncbi:RHS repeat-associated core domain-containing protein [Promicromonospora sp. NPDC023987]|uniref:RHS repeat-associated core domain-containing protein n=1 Tax=Promicromonospora sp. NPDC023987 TaxID=3155360 RepID=UPI0033C771E9
MTGREHAGLPLQELSWDAEGELATVAEDADGDGAVSTVEQDDADGYVYTADGKRVLRTQDDATTLYLGHQEPTLDHSTGSVSGQRYYAFGGMTIATRTGYNFGDVDTIISDQQGTGTVQVPNVDGPGQRVHRYTDPYGKPRGPQASQPGAGGGADGNWTGEHGFLDKPVDATGLTAIGARMYDPLLGKFISVDPIMDLTDPQQWNGYAYSHNNPTTFTDPTGMREVCETGYSCNYGKGGSITKAKKRPKPKPTIWDIASGIRHSRTYSIFRPAPMIVPADPRQRALQDIRSAQAELARARVIAAKARAERARKATIAAQKSAAFYAGTRLASPGGMRGATQAGSVHYWRGFFFQQTGLDIFAPRYNVEVNAGGCVIGCLDGALGYDSKHGPYADGSWGGGAELGVSAGIGIGNGISPGSYSGVAGSTSIGLMTVSGSAVIGPGVIGSAGLGYSPRFGFRHGVHYQRGFTITAH